MLAMLSPSVCVSLRLSIDCIAINSAYGYIGVDRSGTTVRRHAGYPAAREQPDSCAARFPTDKVAGYCRFAAASIPLTSASFTADSGTHPHGPGCACCGGGKSKSRAVTGADGSKTFPADRPWMISH
jgi:hypothetical protein